MLIGWNSGETFFFLGGSFLKPLFPQLLVYICEEQVKRTKGFVLQIQQGVSHEKSHMQVAEEQQSAWLNVPRIAVFAFEGGRHEIGGGSLAKTFMETALAKAEEQWTNGVEAELQMCSERYEPVDGADKVPTDSRGHVHGMAKCTYPHGDVYVGQFEHGLQHGHGSGTWPDGGVFVGEHQHGKKHGHGTYTFPNGQVYIGEWQHGDRHGQGTCNYADGAVYVGEYQHDNLHGHGTYTFPNGEVYVGEWQHSQKHGQGTYNYADGAVYVGEYQHGQPHGQGKFTNAESGNFSLGFWVDGNCSGESVQFSKDRQKALHFKDGEFVQELSPSEAAKKVEELGLSKLLSWNVSDPIWRDFGRRKVTKSCQIVVKLSKKWAKSRIILTAKSTGIGFENYSSLMFSLSCFYLQKKAPT